jgi:hypothetical protein
MTPKLFKQEIMNCAGSTTHSGRYLCSFALCGGVWFMIGMERI